MKKARYTTELKVNHFCNQRCVFCYDFAHVSDSSVYQGSEISYDALMRLISAFTKSFPDPSDVRIKITGGEPTLHPQLFNIIQILKNAGFNIYLITNGIKLADKDYVSRLSELKVDNVQLSIHGHTPEIHDAIVAKLGAFEKAIKAFDNCSNTGITVSTNTVITRKNLESACDMIDFLSLDLKPYMFTVANTLGEFTGWAKPNMFSYPEITAIAEKVILRIEEFSARGLFITPLPFCLAYRTAVLPAGSCSACSSSVQILQDGNLSPCASLNSKQFRTKEKLGLNTTYDELKKETEVIFSQFKESVLSEYCRSCPLFFKCKAACAVTMLNNLEDNDPRKWKQSGFKSLETYRHVFQDKRWPLVKESIDQLQVHIIKYQSGLYLRLDGSELFNRNNENFQRDLMRAKHFFVSDQAKSMVTVMPNYRPVFRLQLSETDDAVSLAMRLWRDVLSSPIGDHLRSGIAQQILPKLTWE